MKMKIYNPGAPVSVVALGQKVEIGNREIIFVDMSVGSFLQNSMPNLECQPVEKYEDEEKAIKVKKERLAVEEKVRLKANAEYTAKVRGEDKKAEELAAKKDEKLNKDKAK